MEGQDNAQQSVDFKSSDIGKQPKAEYFVKVSKTRKRPIQDFFRRLKLIISKLFKGRLKWLTIGVIVLILAGITCLVLWLTVWRPVSAPADDEGTSEDQESPWQKELRSINDQANQALASNSTTAFLDALAVYDAALTKITDPSQQFDLTIARTTFMINNGAAQSALDNLLAISEQGLNTQQLLSLYLTIRLAYDWLGDDEQSQFYEDRINSMLGLTSEDQSGNQ